MGRSSFEELNSQLYPMLAAKLSPNLVVDVGANYGFTGLIFNKYFPGAELVLIEPSPNLCPYIRQNLVAAGRKDFELIEAICGAEKSAEASFSLNPDSSQDNRVEGCKGWRRVSVKSVTLGSVLEKKANIADRIFIKIDTQGYETHVVKGALDFLIRSNNWFIKMEFAPNWIVSQNNDPVEFLAMLVERFDVVESPVRLRFQRDSLADILSKPLKLSEVEAFVKHVTSLSDRGLGWVDLYVAPRGGDLLREDI